MLDLVGSDADAILHNLTTNDVRSLQVDASCETFLTDVRGKTLAHVTAFRTEDGYRLLGAAGQAEAIAVHADRYTIREDATPTDRSGDFHAAVIAADQRDFIDRIDADFSYEVPWLGDNSLLVLASDAAMLDG
ncbi:MAG: aminomethyltransferase, partial [Planctomycetota bacterium]